LSGGSLEGETHPGTLAEVKGVARYQVFASPVRPFVATMKLLRQAGRAAPDTGRMVVSHEMPKQSHQTEDSEDLIAGMPKNYFFTIHPENAKK
jgi:hypothetical protein